MDIKSQSTKYHDNKKGTLHLSDDKICISTVKNYTALLANDADISIRKKPLYKNTSRIASETSLKMIMSWICSVAITSFIEVNNPKIKLFIPSIEDETPGARHLKKMIMDANGGKDVYPIFPGMLTFTDDSVV